MTCKNCDPSTYYPGKLIPVNKDLITCAICGGKIEKSDLPITANVCRWDSYFHSICIAVASKSSCLSRHIGAILVKDHSIVSTGFNGPSRGIPHCGQERFMKDKPIASLLTAYKNYKEIYGIKDIIDTCPRRLLDYESGTHMELCPAQHAETNAIIDAARKGASTIGTTLYMNCIIPCKNCFGALINAGIVEIVVDDIAIYDKHTEYLISNSSIIIRRFEL
jgi:dCMP deaminase